MKRKALERLIDTLENHVDDEHFRMRYWLFSLTKHWQLNQVKTEEEIPYCQTAGCIAGWVFLGLTPEERADYRKAWLDTLPPDTKLEYVNQIGWVASKELDVTDQEADLLFNPPGIVLPEVKRHHAIKLLKHILNSSEIYWRATNLPELAYFNFKETAANQRIKVTLED